MRPPPPAEHRFPPGVSGNPGGQAKGKRIATWMSEYGQIPPDQWPAKGSDKFAQLPGNAQIALRRLRSANKDDSLGLKNSMYVEPRGFGSDDDGASGVSVVYTIAAAILSLKAAGVEVRKTIDAEVVQPIAKIDDHEEDYAATARRFRRNLK